MSSPQTTSRLASSQSPQPTATLASLVSHFVSSKRSLSSAQFVWRANEIVSTSRRYLEDVAASRSKNAYLQSRMKHTFHSLQRIADGVRTVGDDVQNDLDGVLESVDDADGRVTVMLSQLSSTPVAPALRPADDTSRTLHDFIDLNGTQMLHAALKECIDLTHEAQTDYTRSISGFDESVEAIGTQLKEAEQTISLQRTRRDNLDPIGIHKALENDAEEMASLLQSLVRHFDLCATALRHTEGGGKAVEQAADDLPQGLDVGIAEDKLIGPVSEEERLNMIAVLEKDAEEVEDVVQEITERAEDMEARFGELEEEVTRLSALEKTSLDLVGTMHGLDSAIPHALESAKLLLDRWGDLRERIEEKIGELGALEELYGGFLTAYDGLLVEIARRKSAHRQMEEVARRATEKMQKLYEDDLQRREAFRAAHGEFMPLDLWDGIAAMPVQYELNPSQTAEEEYIPSISNDVVRAAQMRLTEGR